jgi:L-threonylcarbamoyladenylate synthase
LNIQTKVISISNPGIFAVALSCLQSGGVVAFPTDTVYGVAAMIHNVTSIERLYALKERDANKAIAVLIGDLSQLSLVTTDLNENARRLTHAFWPGALTVVVPRLPTLPKNLSQLSTIGVRMPNFNFALQLLKETGPLATTSANLSGQPNPLNANDVIKQLDGRIDLLIDGGSTTGTIASTVVDCTKHQPVILREGAIPKELIIQVINEIGVSN